MSSDRFLEQIRGRFDASKAKSIVSAFRQDPLIWKSVSDPRGTEEWCKYAGNSVNLWTPGHFALFTTSQELNSNESSESLNHTLTKAKSALKSVLMTGLPPGNLVDATGMAMLISDYSQSHPDWVGITGFLQDKRNFLSVWKPAFTILPALVSDFQFFTTRLLEECPEDLLSAYVDLIAHALYAVPCDESERINQFDAHFKTSKRSVQLLVLENIKNREGSRTAQTLASRLMSMDGQTEIQMESKTGSELVKHLQQLTEMHRIAGQSDQATQAIRLTYNAINQTHAAALHDLVLELEYSQVEEARKMWEEIVRLVPENEVYRNEYAEFLIKLGDTEYGLDLLQTSQPSFDTTLLSLRYPKLREKVTLDHDKLKRLLQTTERIESRFSTQSDYSIAATEAIAQKDFQLADSFIQKALLADPNNRQLIRLNSDIQLRLAAVDQAIESSALLALFEPENENHKKELAELYLQSQQPEKALAIYYELVSQTTSPNRADLLTYADLAIKSGKPEVAIPIAEGFLTQEKLDGEALITLVNAMLVNGEREKAVNLLNQTSTIAPEKPESWLSLARLWTSMGNTDQAIDSLRKAKAALPDNPGILLALGKLYLDNQKTTEAIASLKQAYQAEPESREISVALAKAYLQHGYVNEAWMTIRPFESDYSSNPDLALTIGKTMVALGDMESAKAMLKFAWQAKPSNEALEAYAGFLLSQAELKGQLEAQASRELNQLVSTMRQKLDSNYSFELNLLLADSLATLSDYQSAYQIYLGLLDQPEAKSTSMYHHLHLQLGRTALQLGLSDISIASLQEAAFTDPDDLATRQVLTEAYLKAGLHSEAFNSARSVYQMEPNNLQNLLWYCNFMAENDNPSESTQVLEDALRLRPDEKAIYLTLAKIYSAEGSKADTKQILHKLLSLENITTEEYINVANLFLNLNEAAEAQQIISKAIADNPQPDFGETRDLAYSVLRFGDPAAAAALLDRVTEQPEDQERTILRADVLTANKQFLKALELLDPLLKESVFNPEIDESLSAHQSPATSGFLPFSRDGILHRATLLLLLTGDFQAAKRYAGLMSQQDSHKVRELQAQIAFASGTFEKFEQASLEDATALTVYEDHPLLAKLAVLNAMLRGELTQVKLYQEHILAKATNRFFESSVDSWVNSLAQHAEPTDTEWMLNWREEALETQRKSAFKPAAYLDFIWDCTAMALAGWEAQDWHTASTSFSIALSETPVMPVINKAYADYLVDKTRVFLQSQILGVTKHSPMPEIGEVSDQELQEKQVALAGRFIPANDMIGTLKLSQAIFSGRWNELDELSPCIKSGRQAAQALLIVRQPDLVQQIVSAFPQDNGVLFQSALNHLESSSDLSLEIAQKLMALSPQNPWYPALAARAERESNPQAAIHSIETALAIWPDEDGWHIFAADMLEEIGEYSKAVKQMEAALQLNPKNASYWQMLGDIKVKSKDFHAAKDYFAKANELFPDNPVALESLAKINQQLGEPKIALAMLEKAVALEPHNPAIRESVAELMMISGDFQSAILHADRVLFESPNREKALVVKIKSLQALNQSEEAQRVNESAKSIATDKVPFELLALDLSSNFSDLAKLATSSKLAVSYPDDVAILNNLASRQFAAGLFSEADETLQRSLKNDPSDATTLLLFGKVHRKQGNLDQAIAKLNQAIRSDPSLIEAYLEIGLTFQERREVGKAIDTYKKAIHMVSSDPRPYVYLATAYKDSRDYKNAEEMFRKAAQISPNDPGIRRQLAAIAALNLVTNLQEASKHR